MATRKPAASAKTVPTDASVDAFLATIDDPVRLADARRLVALMQAATGCPPVLWGGTIVGFGRHAYRYDSGRSGETALLGFSPRKAEFALYLGSGLERHADALAALGPHRAGKGCLYLKRLDAIDTAVLARILEAAVAATRAQAAR